MKFKSTAALISSILFLLASSSSTVFADAPPAQAIGSGVLFYAWNANGHCSTDTSINPTGKCPTLWTDTIKNINAQIPASADRAKIKFIYLDSVALNLPQPPSSPTPTGWFIDKNTFQVGACGDETTSDVVFCSESAGLSYSTQSKEPGYAAVSDLRAALGSGYYILPTISDSGDASLEYLSPGQFQSLAYSLACLVNPSNTTTPTWGESPSKTPFPNKCADVLKGSHLGTTTAIDGLAFDIESPDLSSSKNKDTNSAADFYTALQTAMGASSSSNPKFIMVSRGPNGLNENQNGVNFGSWVNTLNGQTDLATFIFAPQIYDVCSGLASSAGIDLACPTSAPYTYKDSSYSGSLFFQALPASEMSNTQWPNPIQNTAFAPYLFFSSLYNIFFTSKNGQLLPDPYPSIPIQAMISGGSSTQIWSHTNLYNADFQDSNPSGDPFITGVTPATNAPVSFQPSMIYQNKKACQAENPDGSLGITIPNCVTYPNPYSETIASYANTLFTSLQYTLGTSTNSPAFSGIALYPFTPYGFWDATCTKKSSICQGFFPEVPDGLINGEKPQISFWDTYLNQFANQWIGSSTGTIPGQNSLPASKLFITLPTGYYQLNPGSGNNLGTATVLFNTATYPNGQIPSISSYRANLIDAIGQIIATGTSLTSGSIMINNAPGGNYKLEVQALDQNGSVLASTEAAAEGAGLPPVLQIALSQVALSGTPTSSSYTLSWTLSCSSSATLPSGFLAVSQLYASGNSSPLSRLTQWTASPACGQTYSSSFTLSKGSFPNTATQASLVLQEAGTFQNITTPVYVPITIPSS